MFESKIVEGIKAGERKALASLLSICEDDPEKANSILNSFERRPSHVVGITGSPGVGKSSLINAILNGSKEKKIGVIAIDPSSPFTGGALLGDRIRMQSHATSENFFIRSFASRGALGGLSPSIFEACNAFEAFGMDMILIETVGVGQSDIEIANVADTVVVLLSADGGDEVQMMKAGLMEIADIFVVNKADNIMSRNLLSKLKATIEMGKKEIPVFMTNAIQDEGVDELLKGLDERFKTISMDGTLEQRRKMRFFDHVRSSVRREIDMIMQKIDLSEFDFYGLKKKVMEELCKRS
jgi:LAO/AO transport system kinase|uniref:Methylmalonyl Co-A mutase-associated GTPase MeaB n=1 Tax=Mesoaciditoga lauensis TaxID=1495039 RepID=A0A7V3RF77_9BACT